MKLSEVKERARELKIDPAKKTKAELVKAIQIAEGNFPCFDTTSGFCDQTGCCWREDCIPT